VEVGASAAPLEATLRRLLGMLAVGLPLTVAGAVAGGFVLVRRALDPVERIARKAEEITQHNLSERLPVVHSGDELERLSVSLNHMITRLQEAMDGSKQFVADASHELRTPLTTLTGFIETLRGPAREDAEARERFLAIMHEQAARMIRLVEDLLSLSRIELNERPRASWWRATPRASSR
jgi:signal transduction histidine kinase